MEAASFTQGVSARMMLLSKLTYYRGGEAPPRTHAHVLWLVLYCAGERVAAPHTMAREVKCTSVLSHVRLRRSLYVFIKRLCTESASTGGHSDVT